MASPGPEVPYDPVNERVVIRAALADGDVARRLTLRVRADEFLVPEHAAIWCAVTRAAREGVALTEPVLVRYVADEGGDTSGSYLRELIRTAERTRNLDWHVETMSWDATKARTLDGPVRHLVDLLQDPKAESDRILGSARSIARSLEGSGRRYIRSQEELRRSYVASSKTRRVVKPFASFGFEIFDDKLTEGALPKRTSLVAGLSGSGKSTFCAELTMRQAQLGRRPLYCAWEMDPESVIDLMVSSRTGISLMKISRGDVTDREQLQIEGAVNWITKHIRFMDNPFVGRRRDLKDSSGRRIREYNEDRQDYLEGYIAESGCDFIVYDLWERMLCDLSYDGVTKALYRQQAMHTEYSVHGTIVHQLRGKDVERRKDKRPTREAIKGTGAFVEVSDLILGIHREGQLKAVDDDGVEIICLKQRKGIANWAYRFDWIPESCRIRGGQEVSYDPGLESTELDALAAIRGKKSPPRRRR